MILSQLDFYFPFFVFFYGISLLFVMTVPAFAKIRERILQAIERRTAHEFGDTLCHKMRWSGSNFSEFSLWIMTILSGVWSLQNLLLS